MKLYTSALCPFAHRVRLVLREKGIEPEEIEVDPRHKPPELVARGPFGSVPVLETAECVLSESSIIAEYLNETYPIPALMPWQSAQRAEARLWIKFADDHLYTHTRQLLYAAPESERPRVLTQIREDLRFMERHVASKPGPFWLGERFTLVDLTFFPWFEQRVALEKYRGFTWPTECVRLARWLEHVAARPAVRSLSEPPGFYEKAYGQLMGALPVP